MVRVQLVLLSVVLHAISVGAAECETNAGELEALAAQVVDLQQQLQAAAELNSFSNRQPCSAGSGDGNFAMGTPPKGLNKTASIVLVFVLALFIIPTIAMLFRRHRQRVSWVCVLTALFCFPSASDPFLGRALHPSKTPATRHLLPALHVL